jgi:hypothetical protein
VLELLLRNAGSVVTREQIAEVALGRPLKPSIAASTCTSAICARSWVLAPPRTISSGPLVAPATFWRRGCWIRAGYELPPFLESLSALLGGTSDSDRDLDSARTEDGQKFYAQ